MKQNLILGFTVMTAVLLTASFAVQVQHTPRFHDVVAAYVSEDRIVLDRSGQVIDEVRSLTKPVRRLNWVALATVPPLLGQTLIRAEDKHFYYHPGFDPLAEIRALGQRLTGRAGREPKTLSMQVSEWLDAAPDSDAHPWLLRWKAMVLEAKWSKREILEAYMNLAYYHHNLQGLSAASFALFDKSPMRLSRAEMAELAAWIHPSETAPRERVCQILTDMGSAEECGLLSDQHLANIETGYNIRPFVRMAPQVAQRLSHTIRFTNQGSLIRSTLDRQLQWLALSSLERHGGNGGVVVIENATGDVLVDVGGNETHVAGATLKPWLFAKAFDERILTAATVLEDSPLAISANNSLFRPPHVPRLAQDLVTVRAALTSNLNIPAVQVLELLTVDSFVQLLTDLGFGSLERPEYYGPTLALGAADVQLLELTNAYRTLANGGLWSPVRFSPEAMTEQENKRILSPEAAFLVTDILADPVGPLWAAQTASLNREQHADWHLGYSDKYTVGVWTQDFSSQEIWLQMLKALHAQESSPAPRPPEGLAKLGDDWFIKGTEPLRVEIAGNPNVRSRIAYPLDQSKLALDAALERQARRMFFQILAPKDNQNLYLNGHRLGRAQAYRAWEPRTGKFTLELRDSQGQVVDTVHFEVRGSSFAVNVW